MTVLPFLIYNPECNILVRRTSCEYQEAGIRVIFGSNEFVRRRNGLVAKQFSERLISVMMTNPNVHLATYMRSG